MSMSNIDTSLSDLLPDRLSDPVKNGNGSNPYGHDEPNGAQNRHNFGDMDSAALLESLANFEPIAGHETSAPANSNENNSFERLLQAAATAGGQEAREKEAEQQQAALNNGSFNWKVDTSQDASASPKRKRVEAPQNTPARPGKRQKQLEAEYEVQRAKEQEIWGESFDEDDFDDASTRFERPQSVTGTEARAMGVHSAAALFRRPSDKSRKYTRPPMARLFSSLQITAEEFIHLQAAAKDFMLDEKHPERYETVGSKARGDTDMVKLKLFGCVKTFLEDGWGERLWGKGATEPEKQTLRWPESDKRITSLITPLLRRMVTNERQRRYASDQRLKKAKEKEAAEKRNEQGDSLSPQPEVDPKLDEYETKVAPHLPAELMNSPPELDTGPEPAVEEAAVNYHVNIIHDSCRLKPKLTLTPNTCPGFSSLVQHIHNLLEDTTKKMKNVKVLGPYGRVNIDTEDAWRETVKTVQDEEWMDGDVKVIVQVEEKS